MLFTAIAFIVILSILVLIHELGHYTIARLIGVHVEEFGLGLPPRIWGKKIGKTIYSLNWLPIGGFVKLAGEDEEVSEKTRNSKIESRNSTKKFFWARSKKERAAILLAGVTMNFLLAVGITTYLLIGGVPTPSGRVHVETVVDNSPAKQAGLVKNDIIHDVHVQNQTIPVKTPDNLISTVRKYSGTELVLTVSRGGQTLMIPIVPRKTYPKGEGPMGVAISDLETKKYSLLEAPVEAVKINLSRAWEMVSSVVLMIFRLVTFQPLGGDVAGPIGIAQVTGQAVKFGFRAVLEFMSVLSLNLAVLNVLPIPALDGGRLLFVFIEKFLGRRVRPAFEKNAHQIGMIILLFLVLLVSIKDILRLVRGG